MMSSVATKSPPSIKVPSLANWRMTDVDEINAFKSDPACRVYLSADSGAAGLNLQHALTPLRQFTRHASAPRAPILAALSAL